ncbi:hypothetical protein FISHEDRAFT_69110 [Fistulina hepatica ATCC 64428]|uniref:F-box domain-containing protein n=1 Tax=Fistulina hepatica ATCC 64428 TaxID=1128425 RepID=A0A0D7ANX0_9AGAR|nr:hypothetical protein FISHEDRAFT_69110 [Fistulina hepatica ATCC 64428]
MSASQMIDGHAKKDLSIALPTETLTEIFISGVSFVSFVEFDMDNIDHEETFLNPKAIPLSVSQASNRSLNSISVVSNPRESAAYTHGRNRGLDRERSRDHPLDIEHVYHGSQKSGAFLKLMARHCERWRSFRIEAETKSSWVHLLHSIRGRLPLLSSLVIKSEVSDCFIFEEAPRLTRVALVLSPGVALPWAQLTHYEGIPFYETFTKAENVLFHMPNIEVFQAWGIMPYSFPVKMPEVLRNLTEMYMYAYPIGKVLNFAVSAPNLRFLSACIMPQHPVQEVMALTAFIKQSSCALDQLKFTVSYKDDDDDFDASVNIVELLRQCSSVEAFDLKIVDYSSRLCGIINALARNDKLNGIILPKLRQLKFSHRVCPRVPSQDVALALTNTLHARQQLSVVEKLPIIEDVRITMDIAPPAGTCADLWKGISDKRSSMVWKVESI